MALSKGRTEIELIDIAILCARFAEERKGRDIKVLEVGEILPITEFFVLVTGTSPRHVRALTEEMTKKFKEKKLGVPTVEGSEIGWWVLLDAGGVVVHVFEEKAREFYELDSLWADARSVAWQEPP
jgi:ribosome-associated protein